MLFRSSISAAPYLRLRAPPTANNGNLMLQAINLPGFSQTQYYEYDAVNRLQVAAEGATIPASKTCPATNSWCREYNEH